MEKKKKKQEKKQKFGNKKQHLFQIVTEKQLKGFLISCDKNKEKNALKEAFNVLNSIVEQIYPNLERKQKIQEQSETEEQLKKKVEISISNQLEQELQSIRQENSKIFYNLDIGVKKNIVFVKINPDYTICPLKISDYAMKQVYEQNQSLGKFCHKLIPILKIIPAEEELLEQALIELIDEYLPHNQECTVYYYYSFVLTLNQ